MDVRFCRTEENIIECEAYFDAVREAIRGQRIAALDLVKIDAADDWNVGEYTFVAHACPFG
jgi:hypothetical protein